MKKIVILTALLFAGLSLNAQLFEHHFEDEDILGKFSNVKYMGDSEGLNIYSAIMYDSPVVIGVDVYNRYAVLVDLTMISYQTLNRLQEGLKRFPDMELLPDGKFVCCRCLTVVYDDPSKRMFFFIEPIHNALNY